MNNKIENTASSSSSANDEIQRLPQTEAGGPTISFSHTPVSHALIEVMASGREPPEELAVYHLATPKEQRTADDHALQTILDKYLTEDKERKIVPAQALEFVKEQQRQLIKPKKEQNWSEAKRLYLEMQGISPEEMKAVEGGLFKGGWIGAGAVYGLSSQLTNFLSVLPSIYTASVSREKLQKYPVHYAVLNLSMQMGFSLATPLINAAIQIPMVARQDLMRSKGFPARSKEMKAPGYPKTIKAMSEVIGNMQASNAKLEAHSKELEILKVGTPEWNEKVRLIEVDGAEAVALMSRHTDLLKQFQVRKDVTDLNYISQYYLALNRVLRVAGTLAAQVAGTATHNSHLSAYIQIGTGVVTMGLQQFWAAPKGQFIKFDDTLMATIRSTNLIKSEQSHLSIEELREDSLDLTDVPKQWTRGATVGLEHFKEYLELHVKYREQNMADLVKMDPHEWRQLQALEAKNGSLDIEQGGVTTLTEEEVNKLSMLKAKMTPLPAAGAKTQQYQALEQELMVLKQDLESIKRDDWLNVSPENRKILLQSVDGNHEWQTAFRTAGVRMQLPSDFIPQVGQRFGAQFQMVIAGSNMPLIVSALLRLVQAISTEAHRKAVETLAQAPAPLNTFAPVVAAAPTVAAMAAPVVSDTGRYLISFGMSLIGVAGAFSNGALVNDKITQRAELRKAADEGETPRVGFQLSLTSRAFRSIGRSMVAMPIAIKNRMQIDNKAREGKNMQAQLQGRMDRLRAQLPVDSQGAAPHSAVVASTLLPQGST